MNEEPKASKKDILKTLAIAFLIVFIGQIFLAWQYFKLERERIPFLEEQVKQQEEEMEKRLVEDVLERFLIIRIEGNETVASHYLTEVAMQEKENGDFILINDFESYEIQSSEKIDDIYRFIVKLYERDTRNDITEVIVLKKLLNQYYIDSVKIAG